MMTAWIPEDEHPIDQAKDKSMIFPHLFSPISINGMVLRNRIVMTAMHLGYTPGGHVSRRLEDFYTLRAKGGAGLIIVGGR
jgi:2,4-dienoyl-CoA reductase (NADPH2)